MFMVLARVLAVQGHVGPRPLGALAWRHVVVDRHRRSLVWSSSGLADQARGLDVPAAAAKPPDVGVVEALVVGHVVDKPWWFLPPDMWMFLVVLLQAQVRVGALLVLLQAQDHAGPRPLAVRADLASVCAVS